MRTERGEGDEDGKEGTDKLEGLRSGRPAGVCRAGNTWGEQNGMLGTPGLPAQCLLGASWVLAHSFVKPRGSYFCLQDRRTPESLSRGFKPLTAP